MFTQIDLAALVGYQRLLLRLELVQGANISTSCPDELGPCYLNEMLIVLLITSKPAT